MRRVLACLAVLLAMVLTAVPASANHQHHHGMKAKAVKSAVHRHSHRCHHCHHRHARRPHEHRSVMFYHAEPRRTWVAHRYYAVPYYSYRPHYFSASGYAYHGARWHRWHHRHW